MVYNLLNDNYPSADNIKVLTSFPNHIFVKQADGRYKPYKVSEFVAILIRGERVD